MREIAVVKGGDFGDSELGGHMAAAVSRATGEVRMGALGAVKAAALRMRRAGTADVVVYVRSDVTRSASDLSEYVAAVGSVIRWRGLGMSSEPLAVKMALLEGWVNINLPGLSEAERLVVLRAAVSRSRLA